MSMVSQLQVGGQSTSSHQRTSITVKSSCENIKIWNLKQEPPFTGFEIESKSDYLLSGMFCALAFLLSYLMHQTCRTIF